MFETFREEEARAGRSFDALATRLIDCFTLRGYAKVGGSVLLRPIHPILLGLDVPDAREGLVRAIANPLLGFVVRREVRVSKG